MECWSHRSTGETDCSYDPAMDEIGPMALGVVVERDRGSLPFALLHGEPLVACAAWAMGVAGVHLLDLSTPWEAVQEAGLPLVWHDALCPATPPDLIATCVRRAVERDAVVAAVLAVTDTVKELAERPDGPVVGDTLDREGLRHLVSPLVLPSSVVVTLDDWPDPAFATVLASVRTGRRVELVDAPSSALRVHDLADVVRLEALTAR
jgi:2-C-methyl-D-erythritol 4-phosphate cytidylyltransferase